MKRTVAEIAAILLLFSACNFSIPEKVSVKTNANYNYSIGNISQDFSETFQAKKLFGNLETDDNKIYDYFPGQEDAKLQQYLLTIKIPNVDLPQYTIPAGIPVDLTIPPVTVDFDISSIFASIDDVLGAAFGTNAGFCEIPLYIYCSEPSGFSSSEVKGSVTIKYKVENNSSTSTEVKIGDETTLMPYFSAPQLNITDVVVDGVTEKDVVDTVLKPGETSLNGDINSILNGNKNNKGKIELEFNLKFSGTTDGKPFGNLGLNAFIIIPLKFKMDGIVDISLTNLAKKDSDKGNEDVFNRSKATDTSDIKKYLDVIEKIEINYKAKKNPIVTDSNTCYVVKSTVPYISKKLDVNEDSLRLTNEEFQDMLNVYPFNPELNINIPSDSILSLPRHLGIDMNMNISLYTNGVINIKE